MLHVEGMFCVCILNQVEKFCIPTTRFYLTSRQVTCVDNQYHAITYRGYVNVSCFGNAVTTTRQTSDTSMNFCPRNESWKQREDYFLGFLYNKQLLVLCQTHKSRKRGVSLPFFQHYFVDFKFSLFVVHLMMFAAAKTI